jgi:hypothetical protein
MKTTNTKCVLTAFISITFFSIGALAQQATEIRTKPAGASVAPNGAVSNGACLPPVHLLNQPNASACCLTGSRSSSAA